MPSEIPPPRSNFSRGLLIGLLGATLTSLVYVANRNLDQRREQIESCRRAIEEAMGHLKIVLSPHERNTTIINFNNENRGLCREANIPVPQELNGIDTRTEMIEPLYNHRRAQTNQPAL